MHVFIRCGSRIKALTGSTSKRVGMIADSRSDRRCQSVRLRSAESVSEKLDMRLRIIKTKRRQPSECSQISRPHLDKGIIPGTRCHLPGEPRLNMARLLVLPYVPQFVQDLAENARQKVL
jgi:hypothetical protein